MVIPAQVVVWSASAKHEGWCLQRKRGAIMKGGISPRAAGLQVCMGAGGRTHCVLRRSSRDPACMAWLPPRYNGNGRGYSCVPACARARFRPELLPTSVSTGLRYHTSAKRTHSGWFWIWFRNGSRQTAQAGETKGSPAACQHAAAAVSEEGNPAPGAPPAVNPHEGGASARAPRERCLEQAATEQELVGYGPGHATGPGGSRHACCGAKINTESVQCLAGVEPRTILTTLLRTNRKERLRLHQWQWQWPRAGLVPKLWQTAPTCAGAVTRCLTCTLQQQAKVMFHRRSKSAPAQSSSRPGPQAARGEAPDSPGIL